MNLSEKSPFYFREVYHDKKCFLELTVLRWVHSQTTRFQKIDIFDTPSHGRVFALDGIVQTMERWEFMYHEMIAHVPMMICERPKQVLVIGGGDGGTVREVLRHPSVERVVLCEVDREVVEAAKTYLPTLSHAFSDERLSCVFADGAEYLKGSPQTWDVIIIDSTDPTAGEGGNLFTESFYALCRDRLLPKGVCVAQTENPIYDREWMRTAYRRIAGAFPTAGVYLGFSPQYPSGFWTYSIGYRSEEGQSAPDFYRLSPEKMRRIPTHLRYYTADVHHAAFQIPPFLSDYLA
ncbi:MAG TPA: polyamine aminopropyltransferase [Thermotogota bacterium]|nr:polyamine aminopropyltransferase [Thermotogota bacterium]